MNDIVRTPTDLNNEIRRLNENPSLGTSDRLALLDELLRAWPKETPNPLYQTTEIIVPGGKRRAISVSGQTIAENEKTLGPEYYWPLIEIFELRPGRSLAYPDILWVQRPDARTPGETDVNVMRHVQILGPCFVHHDPSNPVDGLPRRACVMWTDAPLRVFVDTIEQAKKNGKGHLRYNEYNFTGRFGC